MKSHIAYGIKFIKFIHANQFLQHFVFLFEKTIPWLTIFNMFTFDKKYLFSSRNLTSSFDKQDVIWIRLCTKIHTLQFYLDLILINLNKQAYSLIFQFISFLLLTTFLWKTLKYNNLVLVLNNFFSFLLLQI